MGNELLPEENVSDLEEVREQIRLQDEAAEAASIADPSRSPSVASDGSERTTPPPPPPPGRTEDDSARHHRSSSLGIRTSLRSAIRPTPHLEACLIGEADFDKLKVIGSGQFGKVVLVQKRDTQRYYAMKIMKKSDILQRHSLRHIRTEKILLAGVDHPFIVRCYWVFQDLTKLFMVMDFVNGGEIYYHLARRRRFTEERTRFYAAELFLALKYLHANQIIHRDLKLENLLLGADGHMILTDFGLSKILEKRQQGAKTLCGTVTYVSPEMIAVSKKRRRAYGTSVDWWALGVVIHEMLLGESPFQGEDVREIYHNILALRVTFPRRPRISREAKDMIRGLLRKRPRRRLGCKSPDDIQNHPWFEGIDWDRLMRKEITPPYVPNVSGPADCKFIASEFLDMDMHSLKTPVSPEMIRRYKEEFQDFDFAKEEPED